MISLLVITSGCATLQGGFGRLFGGRGQAVGGQGVQLTWLESPKDGAEIQEGQIINFAIQVDNYVPTGGALQGQLCLRDDLLDSYAGIRSSTAERCKDINLPRATQTDRGITPSSDIFTFGPYLYQNIPEALSLSTGIHADLKYEVEAQAGADACIKRLGATAPKAFPQCGQEQNLQVKQTDLPIKITKITASPSSLSTTETLLNLEIEVSKAVEGQVLTKGTVLGEEPIPGTASVEFDVSVNNIQADCRDLPNKRLVIRQNENEKVINCEIKISLNQDFIQAPIIIKMGYGFIQSKLGPEITLVKNKGGN